MPDGVSFSYGTAASNGEEYYKTVNNYSNTEWKKMEAKGAVFLPVTGYRRELEIFSVASTGTYWTSQAYDEHYARRAGFGSNAIHTTGYGDYGCGCGRAVRLVQDVK